MTFSCTNCQSEFENWYSRGRCLDCGSQLRDDTTGALIPLPAEIENVQGVSSQSLTASVKNGEDTLDAWIEQRDSLVVVTSNEVPGYESVTYHGDVMGITVLARNVVSNIGANMRQFIGGEVGAYVKMLTDGRKVALTRMRTEALKCGANAVIAMRLDANQISDVMTELIAYGTAVTIRPRRELHQPE
jgi:uncharacterized protein YbjQ (UPF0145 family)